MQSTLKNLAKVNFDDLFDSLQRTKNLLSYVSDKQLVFMEQKHNQTNIQDVKFLMTASSVAAAHDGTSRH